MVASSSRAAEPSTKPVVRRAAGEAPDDPHDAQHGERARSVTAAQTAPPRRSASTTAGADPSCSRLSGHARQPPATGSKKSAGDHPEHPDKNDITGR